MLNRPILVPPFLHFVYGEKTYLRYVLLIHGSALIASLVVLVWGYPAAGWTAGQTLVAVLLAWDLVGGGVAHMLPENRQFWRSLRVEWLVVWVASYAWQPLLFIGAFGGGLSLLATLHLTGIALVLAQKWLGNRLLIGWTLLAIILGYFINQFIAIPGVLGWFPLLYLVKIVLFDKAPLPARKPPVRSALLDFDDYDWK